MSGNKVVSARLDIEVFAHCPHCDFMVDLMNEDDTDGYCHNDEGHVMRQACPDGYWSDKHKEFSVVNVTCGSCKKDFDVKELEW